MGFGPGRSSRGAGLPTDRQKDGGVLFWDLLDLIVNCPPPPLPKGHFSDSFADVVHACMAADGAARPTANQLLTHQWLDASQSAGELSEWLIKDIDADR